MAYCDFIAGTCAGNNNDVLIDFACMNKMLQLRKCIHTKP